MKKLHGFKIVLLTLFMALTLTSCDGCSRQNEGSNDAGTRTGKEANGDIDGSPRPGGNENSGSSEGTNTSSGTGSDRSQE